MLLFFQTPLILLKTYFARRFWPTQLRCSLYPSSSEIISVACRLAAHYHWQRAAIRYRYSFCSGAVPWLWMVRNVLDWFWWKLYTLQKPEDECRTSFSIKTFVSRRHLHISQFHAEKNKTISIHFEQQMAIGDAMRRDDGNQLPSSSMKYPFYFFRLTQNTYLRTDRFCLSSNAIQFAWALVRSSRPEMK